MSTPDTFKNKSILILEDKIIQADALELSLKKSGYQNILKVHQGIKAIEAFEDSEKAPDIALLDINLAGQPINGIQVGEKIMQLDTNALIIFLTDKREDEIFGKALRIRPYAFIQKPYQFSKLDVAIEGAIKEIVEVRRNLSIQTPKEQINRKSKVSYCSDFLWIKDNRRGYERVYFSDLFYLKGNGSFTDVNLGNGKKFMLSNYRMKTFDENFREEEKFDKQYACLVRIHNSFIVNLMHISVINMKSRKKEIHLTNGVKLNISKSYVDNFWKAMNLYRGK